MKNVFDDNPTANSTLGWVGNTSIRVNVSVNSPNNRSPNLFWMKMRDDLTSLFPNTLLAANALEYP